MEAAGCSHYELPHAVKEWKRPFIRTQDHCVADQLAAIPGVQQKPWWLHAKRAGAIGTQIQRHLVRGTWGCHGRSVTNARVNVAVQMPAQNGLNLRMTANDGSERIAPRQADGIHMRNSGGKRRVVHQDQRWRVR